MHENLVSALYSLVQLHRWSKVVFISAFYIVTGLFDWLLCVFMVFNVILLLFVNHLKDFFLWFTDCLTIAIIHETMVVHMTWVWTFSTIIAIIRACACWALFVVTLTNTVHLIYTYIYIYQAAQQLTHKQQGPLLLTWINFNPSIDK